MSTFYETIVAIATPVGRGGIGIVRISGPQAVTISQPLIQGSFPKPRIATYRNFIDDKKEVLDQGVVLYFPHPNSFTGEDIVEFQGHGSPVILNTLLKYLCRNGARLARPGEFSERAFLNGRLDLVQAEAIADLIHAGSEKAARAAVRSLEGVFSKKIEGIHQHLINLRTLVESAIDFSEESIILPNKTNMTAQLRQLIYDLKALQVEAGNGQRLQEGMALVMLGSPNAGKSSLLNALSGQEVAIISEIPGTTRDVLTADLDIDGLPIYLLDTAGLHQTEDIVEKEGIRRALKACKKADQILWVVDSTQKKSTLTPHEILATFNQLDIKVPITIVQNKIDLTQEKSEITYSLGYDMIRVSAMTGEGIPSLKTYLKQKIGYETQMVGFSARVRHLTALHKAEQVIEESLLTWQQDGLLELLAFHLNEAHQLVGEIRGIFTTEDLLGSIFSTFCIGK